MDASDLTAAAAVRLALRHPFWTELYYSMGIEVATPEQVAGGLMTEATDGRTIWINAPFFQGLQLDQQVLEVVHELGHKAYLHPTRMGMRDPHDWNIACDHAINTMLKDNGFNVPHDWVCDMKYNGWLAETIYAEIHKENEEDRRNGDKPRHSLPDGRDDVKQPQDMSPEQIEAFEDQVKAQVDRAIANAKAMGQLPKGMEQGIVQAYKAPAEPWYNHLHRYMQALSASQYNWARMNRRVMITHGVLAPLHYSESLGDIAIFIDTSGSCFATAQQMQFAGHMNAIMAEARPRRIHQYYFDSKVYPGAVIEAGEVDVVTKPRGGGGTSFVPIFAQLETDGITPDVCIILTDLDGRFPAQEPGYPVVWVDTLGRKDAPFGEVIRVDD